MKTTLTSGLKAEVRHRVVTQELLSSIYHGGPPVFATPHVLSLMEQAAATAIQPHLDEGEASVGYGFNFHHLAPTAVGSSVIATAEVMSVEKNMVTFHIEARRSRCDKPRHSRAGGHRYGAIHAPREAENGALSCRNLTQHQERSTISIAVAVADGSGSERIGLPRRGTARGRLVVGWLGAAVGFVGPSRTWHPILIRRLRSGTGGCEFALAGVGALAEPRTPG